MDPPGPRQVPLGATGERPYAAETLGPDPDTRWTGDPSGAPSPLLCETDTVLTAINDLLTANCCNSATTEAL